MIFFRFCLIYFFSSLLCGSYAQIQIPNVNADYIKNDPYGNIYAVKDAHLSKFSPNGKLLYNFSDFTLGTISSVDVFNPMKIMIFYKDAGAILFLNEQLAIINSPISLHDANYFSISLASYSAANQIHLYQHSNKYLITLDFNMREISKTPINFPYFDPKQMIELEEKSLAFQDPELGVFLFDPFGTFYKSIPVFTSNPVEVTTELIYYTNNNEVNIYNYISMSNEKQKLPFSNVAQTLFYRNKMILLLQNNTIWIYEKNENRK
ncbi:MAG: hypothetical protein LBU83_09655 [Bacteroidales bacterium]|jgi:hypothetical protein|nr:hypothetical protein [Bacteroidales bacterium]